MESVTFVIFGRPQQRGSKKPSLIPKRGGGFLEKHGRPIIATRDDNAKSTDWMAQVRSTAADAFRGELLTGPIQLTARFYFRRPASHFGTGRNARILKPSAPTEHAKSPDLAKLLRCLEDALTGVIWRDDRQVFRYGEGTQRFWTTKQERCEVEILEFDD